MAWAASMASLTEAMADSAAAMLTGWGSFSGWACWVT